MSEASHIGKSRDDEAAAGSATGHTPVGIHGTAREILRRKVDRPPPLSFSFGDNPAYPHGLEHGPGNTGNGQETPNKEESEDKSPSTSMSLKQTLKGLFTKKRFRKTETSKDHDGKNSEPGTEMTGLGSKHAVKGSDGGGDDTNTQSSVIGTTQQEHSEDQMTGDAVAKRATEERKEQCATGASKTEPVQPPRDSDNKGPNTVAGPRSCINKPVSMTSDYGSISEASSLASNVSDGEKVRGQSDSIAVSGASEAVKDTPEELGARDSAASAPLSSSVKLEDSAEGGSGSDTAVLDEGEKSSNTIVLHHSESDIGARGPDKNSASGGSASGKTSQIRSLFQVPLAAVVPAKNPASSGTAKMVEAASNADGLFPQQALNTPIGSLRKSQKRICLHLNIEQDPIEGDLPPDYRGLAELLDFDYLEIQNFYAGNPTQDMLRQWARCQEKQPFLWNLVKQLAKLGRQDVLEDCCGLILEDVADHVAEQNLLQYYTVNRLSHFDCYVNIADEDLISIGREIIDTLEGVYQLRLCLTLRDIRLGEFEFEEMAKMLETRCGSKVVIVLSRHYNYSGACQFLTQFAVTLDPGARMNKLIPLLVDEDVEVPRVLRCLAMLNYHRDRKLGFLWPRLRAAIKS